MGRLFFAVAAFSLGFISCRATSPTAFGNLEAVNVDKPYIGCFNITTPPESEVENPAMQKLISQSKKLCIGETQGSRSGSFTITFQDVNNQIVNQLGFDEVVTKRCPGCFGFKGFGLNGSWNSGSTEGKVAQFDLDTKQYGGTVHFIDIQRVGR